MNLRIAKRQSTYWDFVGPDSTVRAHFVDKKESSFVSPDCDSLDVVSDHPVLLDYRDSWIAIYLASRPVQPAALLGNLAGAVASVVGPWRSPSAYFNAQMDPLALLQKGAGQLACAPQTVAEKLCLALDEWGAAYTAIPSHAGTWPMQAIVAGPNFIVARSFRLDRA
jgi:hypothetical protein